MSQGIVNDVLAKKPKRRVEWVQKRLKEDLAITHRDSLYEVLVRKEGRAFAADISGADAVRTYNAVLAAIELFTTRQQRHLQAGTFLLRQIHAQEQERHKAAQAKAKAAVKKQSTAAKDAPSASGLVQRPAQKDPKIASRPQSPDPPLPSTGRATSSPPNSAVKQKARSERSESPDWIPRTPPQAPPQERKTTGSWTTIFQIPPEEKSSPLRKEARQATSKKEQGAKDAKDAKVAEAKKPKEGKRSKSAEQDEDSSSSSSTEYDAFATGPEPELALRSPSRERKRRKKDAKRDKSDRSKSQSPRTSGLVPQSGKAASASSSSTSSERRRPAIEPKESVVSHQDGDAPSSNEKTRLEHAEALASSFAAEGSDLATTRKLEGSPKANDSANDSANDGKSEVANQECDGSGDSAGSDSSDSEEANDENIQSQGSASGDEEKDADEGQSESDSESSESVQNTPKEEDPQPVEVHSIPDVTLKPASEVTSDPPPLPRRQPPPPPPPARRRMAEGQALPLWRYIAPDGQERLAIRSAPGIDAPTTGGSLGSGEVFAVNQESPGANGVLFLRLADGRGWAFDRKSGLARRRKARPLCVPYQVPLVDEDDLGKAQKRRRPSDGLPKAKRRRRRQLLVDPYMVTTDIIEVESEEEAHKATKASEDAKDSGSTITQEKFSENLRVQLQKKQQEVQALRAKLSKLDAQEDPGSQRQVFLAPSSKVQLIGRRQITEAKDPVLDEKRRELQAMLAKKRAMREAGLPKATPRYVD